MPRLEWTTRPEALKSAANAPFRLLDEVPELSYGDEDTENMIIQGDNLDGLKALLPLYAGQVKCIYIDPPYNTKSAFEHYDDNLEHSTWLSLIYPRLELLRDLLSEDGSIWVSIDDSEMPYLKIIMDEIFGRKSFIATNVWQKRYSRENREAIGDVHEYIIVYAINPSKFKEQRNKIPPTQEQLKVYKNPNNDPRGNWRPIPINAQAGHATPSQFYEIESPNGKIFRPPEGRCWGIAEATFKRLLEEGRIYFGKNGDSQPNIIRYESEIEGFAPWTWWPNQEVGHTDESKKEVQLIFGKDNVFDTPKPERLLQRIIHIATNPNDLVLDSFLGSGTTAAVAHKMNRRYIGIEMGEHAQTHCATRLKKVIDGEQGGISKAVNWTGGGGFRFYKLGSKVFLSDDKINPDVKFKHLASFIWFKETKQPIPKTSKFNTPLIGVNQDTAYYLLYNGILGDRSPNGGNVLTRQILKDLPPHDGLKIIYGESTLLRAETLKNNNILFKQIPYEVQK
ncbi:MAG: site-specific DNA-methyltransferase [Desulfamplus sp.]|nr:site-specific DNA-methyltransferase [Desulfamplus sp.]